MSGDFDLSYTNRRYMARGVFPATSWTEKLDGDLISERGGTIFEPGLAHRSFPAPGLACSENVISLPNSSMNKRFCMADAPNEEPLLGWTYDYAPEVPSASIGSSG